MTIYERANEDRESEGLPPLTPEEEKILLSGYLLGVEDFKEALENHGEDLNISEMI